MDREMRVGEELEEKVKTGRFPGVSMGVKPALTPNEFEAYKIPDRLRKKIKAEHDKYQAPEATSGVGPQIERIEVRCKHSGNPLDAWAFDTGVVRWSCPCGHFFEKAVTELPFLPDLIVIDDDCRRKEWP